MKGEGERGEGGEGGRGVVDYGDKAGLAVIVLLWLNEGCVGI